VQGYVCEGGGEEEDARGGVEGLVAVGVFGDVAGGGVEPAGEEDEVWCGGGRRRGRGWKGGRGGGRFVDVGRGV